MIAIERLSVIVWIVVRGDMTVVHVVDIDRRPRDMCVERGMKCCRLGSLRVTATAASSVGQKLFDPRDLNK